MDARMQPVLRGVMTNLMTGLPSRASPTGASWAMPHVEAMPHVDTSAVHDDGGAFATDPSSK